MTEISREAYFERIGYTPHSAAQAAFHSSKARFRVPVCGRRFGKSRMAGVDMQPKLLLPNKRYWIVGPTYDLGEKEFRVIWDDMIIKQGLGQNKKVKKAYNKRSGEMYIEFPWQTRLEVRSADHPSNLVGEALDGVIMSEAAKHNKETWERYIRPALADKRGFADFPTTPEGFNWLYELWLFGQDKNLPEYASWKFPSWENRVVYPGGREDPEIELLKKTLTPEYFLQEIAAEFASFVGKIFPEWADSTHVRTHDYRPDWPNYISFDWGYTNPLAAVEFQVSPDDTVYVWREHYRSHTTLEDHIAILKERPNPPGYHLDGAFGDAADPEAAMYVSQHLVTCMTNPMAKKNWRQGIDLMRNLMRDRGGDAVDEYGTPEYVSGFYVDPDCMNTIKEINNYKSKHAASGANVPEMGQRVQDHTIDAIRYGLMHIFELGARHHLSDVYDYTNVRSDPGETFTSTGGYNPEHGVFTMSGGTF